MQRTNVTYLKGQIQKAVTTLFDQAKTINWADLRFQIDFDQNEKQEPKTNWDEIMFHRVLPNKIGQTLTLNEVADLLITETNEMPLFIKIKSLQPLKLYGLSISKRFRKLADIERHHKDNPLTPLLTD
jgi:hypothetical protein